MANNEGKYNIKAASKILGIQPGTLRAWERRYQIIAPVRNESGHRLYTEEHIRILKWLMQKVNKGFTISQAVSLFEKNNQALLETEQMHTDQEDMSTDLLNQLLEALLEFNEGQAHELMDKIFSLYSVEKVLIDILGTLLVKIGDMWENDEISSAHEHFASAFLRSRIGMILHGLPVNGFLPKTVSVCGPGEWHELGLLIYTLFVRRKGFETIYLGTSIADDDIHIVLKEIKPKFLFLSCTLSINLPKTLEMVTVLKQQYPELSIGLGGTAVDKMPESKKREYHDHLIGSTMKDWEDWLRHRMN
ncbi:MerR family transcriptional regulator [Sutcliffiella horikoshii]|uniref:MerR family transcriptional regulator n=1 Tax=Sutcliffiella horikoshii TaxID=79883 RepID=UPI0007D047F6|nr:MerR family transcriptional regulator [Sutcliffiella horikoshii]MCM3617402.1 MerR family transcriptional regulator [Sutcliffiella horikoshii]